jgi:hypothetical protein
MVAAWLKNEFLAADSAHIHWSTTKMPGQRRKSPFSPAGWGILQEVQILVKIEIRFCVLGGYGRKRVRGKHGSRVMQIFAAGRATDTNWIGIAAALRAVECGLFGRKYFRLLEAHIGDRIAGWRAVLRLNPTLAAKTRTRRGWGTQI